MSLRLQGEDLKRSADFLEDAHILCRPHLHESCTTLNFFFS
jgi:hypothetical protein